MKSRQFGFTLLELMIVVAVVAILAGLAVNQYGKQVRKGKRAEAKQLLGDLILRQEKYRNNNTSYGTCDQLLNPNTCTSYNALFKNYTVAVTAQSATGYTMTATPKTADQLKDACGTFQVQMATGQLTKTPTTPTDCW